MTIASKVRLWHGRILGPNNPRGGATDVNGVPVDDWGFDGPVLEGCTGLASTYGEHRLQFLDESHRDAARRATGWNCGHSDLDLVILFDEDCTKIWNSTLRRHEHFGDWEICVPVEQPQAARPPLDTFFGARHPQFFRPVGQGAQGSRPTCVVVDDMQWGTVGVSPPAPVEAAPTSFAEWDRRMRRGPR